MATNSFVATIGPSQDYASLALAASATSSRDIITNDEDLYLRFAGDWSAEPDNAATWPSFPTTDATHRVIIDTDAGNKTTGIWDATKARMVDTDYVLIIDRPYVDVRGLQVESTEGRWFSVFGSTDGNVVSACLFRGYWGQIIPETGTEFTFSNCVFTDGDTVNLVDGVANTGAGLLILEYCTFFTVNNGGVLCEVPGDVQLINTVGFRTGTGVVFNGTFTASDYNAASNTSAPGANSVQSIADPFEDSGTYDLRAAASSALDGAGTPTSTTVDLLGVTRDATSPTIGAFEVVSAGVTGVLTTTDGSDTASATGSLETSGTSSIVDTPDERVMSTEVATLATSSNSDAPDGASLIGTTGVGGTATETSQDTASGSSTVGTAGTATETTQDTLTSALTLGLAGSASATEFDAVVATPTVAIGGTTGFVEGDDALVSSVITGSEVTASLTTTDSADAVVSSASVASSSIVLSTDERDTPVAATLLAVGGTSAFVDETDFVAAAGLTGGTAVLTATDLRDAGTGSADIGVSSSLTQTDEHDALASASSVSLGGTNSSTDSQDPLATTTSVPVGGTVTATDSPDTAFANSTPVGNLTATDSPDTASSAGSVGALANAAPQETYDAANTSASVGAGAAVIEVPAADQVTGGTSVGVGAGSGSQESNDIMASGAGMTIGGAATASDFADSTSIVVELGDPPGVDVVITEPGDLASSAALLATSSLLVASDFDDTSLTTTLFGITIVSVSTDSPDALDSVGSANVGIMVATDAGDSVVATGGVVELPFEYLSNPYESRSTFSHRKNLIADKIRKLNTRYGIRPERVYLVWSRFTGEERGEGTEEIIARVELLPRPSVTDATAINRRPYSAGILPEGSRRVAEISAASYTRDMLSGLEIPQNMPRPCGSACGPAFPLQSTAIAARGTQLLERTTDPQVDFWYEIVEDGRGDDVPVRDRYRLLGQPHRDAENFCWYVNLEAADEATNRSGHPQIGVNVEDSDHLTADLEDGDGPL